MENLYNELIGKVCIVCESDKQEILKSNKEETVDARYILIYILSTKLTDKEIAKVTGLSKSYANKVRNTFHKRIRKYSLKKKFDEIKRLIEIKVE